MKDAYSIILMYPCEIDNVHAINRRKLSIMLALEYLFCECYHLLDRDIESATNFFEESVWDVEIDYENIAINRGLCL